MILLVIINYLLFPSLKLEGVFDLINN